MDLGSFAVLNPRFDLDRGLLVLDLDHGKANEMGSAELGAFESLCSAIEAESELRCLCTTSRRVSRKGKPIFIAGANVTERADWKDDAVKAHVMRQRELMHRLRRLPVFHVALVRGITLGWGVEYLLTCDYVLATSGASFALPETGLGILPGARGTAELASVVGPAHALRLGCTGESIAAEEAHRIGLTQELVEEENAMDRVDQLALLLGRKSPTAVAAFKHALLEGLGRPTRDRLELESAAYELCVDSGQAAIGRASFGAIRSGESVEWGPRKTAKFGQ